MLAFEVLGFGAKGWGLLLLYGLAMTIAVTITALIIGAGIGALIAAARLSRNPLLNGIGEGYTTVFRGVPELLVLYFIYFGGSHAVTSLGHWLGFEGFLGLPSFLAGSLGVGVISGAYQAEVYRGSFLAVSKGELEAARACGMSASMRFRRIIAPQVLRYALPGLGNVWQLNLKDSSLVSVTGLAEIMQTVKYAAGSTHQHFLFYIAGACLYLALTSASNRVFDRAEAHISKSFRRGQGG